MPSGFQASEPSESLVAGMPNTMTAGMPRPASSATSLRRLSRVCCTTPGSDSMATGSSIPCRTNSGAIRSSTDRRVSATSRRRAGVRRRRRMRRSGNCIAVRVRRRCLAPR